MTGGTLRDFVAYMIDAKGNNIPIESIQDIKIGVDCAVEGSDRTVVVVSTWKDVSGSLTVESAEVAPLLNSLYDYSLYGIRYYRWRQYYNNRDDVKYRRVAIEKCRKLVRQSKYKVL
jgi:hypothetical protein